MPIWTKQPVVSPAPRPITAKETPKPVKLPRGSTIQVDRFLGGGGFGRVYAVKGQPLAAKVVARKHKELAKVAEREATALAALNHPNIVAFKGYYKAPDGFLLVSELCTGGNLEPLVKAGGLPETQAHPLIRQVTSAMAYCHGMGIIHRDLKPANIVFVDATKTTLKIIDFGACEILPTSGNRPLKDHVQTLGYSAPEVSFSKEPFDGFKADSFSLGVVYVGLVQGCGGGRFAKSGWLQQPTLSGASAELRGLMAGLLHGWPGPRKTITETAASPYFDQKLENVVDWMNEIDLDVAK